MKILFICGLLLQFVTRYDVRNIQCQELPDQALKAILGPTYNARYMSIKPPQNNETDPKRGGPKRSSLHIEHEFFMDGFEENPYEGIPAWEVDHVEITNQQRKRREARSPPSPKKKRDPREVFIESITPRSKIPWECTMEIHWEDLGPEYFPRYIRQVKCKQSKCWYARYPCKPRLFSIKVLKRSTGQCAKVTNKLKIVTMDTVTGEYAQQWEFEERPITVCCDCVMPY